MQRRSLVFIILNVIISLGVALLVIGLWNSQNPPSARVEVITVEVLAGVGLLNKHTMLVFGAAVT
ncbi:MAG TPA: hypothetical protein VHO69_02710, partial [Phototrophicaceae bacterium]|nr:hypothetical protein [Phototrophicaceae bacterium]